MGEARFVSTERSQLNLDLVDLDRRLPADDRVRLVWDYVCELNLQPMYDAIKSRTGASGRPALDPRVLLALWLLGTIDGVGSARSLKRLGDRELAYRWLRGGMPLNYHTLSDLRTAHGADYDRLLSDSLAALLAEELVRLPTTTLPGHW